jgi:hypothetical protein
MAVKTISEIIEDVIPYYKKKGGPEASHTLIYDSASETLEPVYFFVLDLMDDFGLNPQKLIDNFSSSPGSGHFGELGQRMSVMQQQASKILGDINTVLRSVLNVIYDLKEFRMRLQVYDDLKTDKKDAATLSLKQLWMDKVDALKGNSSLKAMALGQAGFQSLIDAFLFVKNVKDVDELDLNERVKRILRPRIQEFNTWVRESGEELRKRYDLEKNYLRSQVNSLQLYSRWAKPYLIAAQKLEMKETKSADLINTFNTILLELTLFGKQKISLRDAPQDLQKIEKKLKRSYYGCVLVDFYYRGIPQRIKEQSHFAFGGKATITFKAYALNDDELKKLESEIEKSDVGDVLSLIEGTTSESLDRLRNDINDFLEEKPTEEEKKEKPKDTSNPFLALFGVYEKKEKTKEKKLKKELPIKPDNWIEKTHLRVIAANSANEKAFNLFDIYKGAHGMAKFT